MPRYYFIIRATDGSYEDPSGTDLPGVQAAKTYAERIVQELREEGSRAAYTALDVQDEAHITIFSVPFVH